MTKGIVGGHTWKKAGWSFVTPEQLPWGRADYAGDPTDPRRSRVI